jgi:hypothetical protein
MDDFDHVIAMLKSAGAESLISNQPTTEVVETELSGALRGLLVTPREPMKVHPPRHRQNKQKPTDDEDDISDFDFDFDDDQELNFLIGFPMPIDLTQRCVEIDQGTQSPLTSAGENATDHACETISIYPCLRWRQRHPSRW